MDTAAFLDYITTRPGYNGQIAHKEHIPAREASYGETEIPLPASLVDCLEQHGLLPLYSHQAQAIDQIRRGENTMVATTSASGKTLCYNIPVLEMITTKRTGRALYLFPTKALAQDQLHKLRGLYCPALIGADEADTFDGDTPRAERASIRKRGRILMTNPDMLHLGILPNHANWARLLGQLKYVVIDEAHNYRGVFGSQVACVMRRLRRLCRLYGSDPTFILCSATIANPLEHAAGLVGVEFSLVEGDGSSHGEKEFVFWNPPLIDEAKSVRRSANSEATELFTALVSQHTRSLAFARTRRLTELVYLYSQKRLARASPGLAERIRPYRAGYLPEDRRRIERQLFSGELLGVVATNALELGIDIGELEATVLTGYPGSIASTWQQAGRSGRGEKESMSFLVAMDNPLDQYLMHHPEHFFTRSFENALVNPDNPYILADHLLCAAWELPLTGSDGRFFGDTLRGEMEELEEKGYLRKRRGRWYLSPSVRYPAGSVNIRSTGGEGYSVIDGRTGSLIETVEASVAFFQIHPGAIYLHQGESYRITRLDLPGRTAYAEPTEVSYYTQSKDITDLHITGVMRSRTCGRVNVFLGTVDVTTAVVAFRKKAQFTEEVLGEEPLDLPPQNFATVALWFDLPAGGLVRLDEGGLDPAGGLHAIEHAAVGMLPLFALCDRNDIGGVSTLHHPDTGRAQVFIYDAHPGGIGIAEKGFDLMGQLWQTTFTAISECPCQEGCPGCIQSPKCGNNNRPLDKRAALLLLEELLAEG